MLWSLSVQIDCNDETRKTFREPFIGVTRKKKISGKYAESMRVKILLSDMRLQRKFPFTKLGLTANHAMCLFETEMKFWFEGVICTYCLSNEVSQSIKGFVAQISIPLAKTDYNLVKVLLKWNPNTKHCVVSVTVRASFTCTELDLLP